MVEGLEGYNRIVNAFNDYQIGSYASSVLINPMNAVLPKLPIMGMTLVIVLITSLCIINGQEHKHCMMRSSSQFLGH